MGRASAPEGFNYPARGPFYRNVSLIRANANQYRTHLSKCEWRETSALSSLEGLYYRRTKDSSGSEDDTPIGAQAGLRLRECTVIDKSDGDESWWVIQRVGPFVSHGGDSTHFVSWNDAGHASAAIAEGRKVYFTGYVARSVNITTSEPIPYPPIHQHHAHLNPSLNPYAWFTGFHLGSVVRAALAAFLLDPWRPVGAMLQVLHAIADARIDQVHGDAQCPEAEGGMDCMVRFVGSFRLLPCISYHRHSGGLASSDPSHTAPALRTCPKRRRVRTLPHGSTECLLTHTLSLFMVWQVHRVPSPYGTPIARPFFTDAMLSDMRAPGSPDLTIWYAPLQNGFTSSRGLPSARSLLHCISPLLCVRACGRVGACVRVLLQVRVGGADDPPRVLARGLAALPQDRRAGRRDAPRLFRTAARRLRHLPRADKPGLVHGPGHLTQCLFHTTPPTALVCARLTAEWCACLTVLWRCAGTRPTCRPSRRTSSGSSCRTTCTGALPPSSG